MLTINSIALIGAGNVAIQLARSFAEKNIQITRVWSRSRQKAEELAALVGAEPITELNKLKQADLFLIAVKDDAIAEVAAQLPSTPSIIAHTSGSVNISVLQQHKEYGVFYPLQTISKSRAVSFSGVPICIEASSEKTSQKLADLARLISAEKFMLNSEQREKIHLSAVLVNNFTNHLLAEAKKFTEQHDVPFRVLQALAKETIEKAFEIGPKQAQTGPALRHDEKTIARHLHLLGENQELKKLYKLFTHLIQERNW